MRRTDNYGRNNSQEKEERLPDGKENLDEERTKKSEEKTFFFFFCRAKRFLIKDTNVHQMKECMPDIRGEQIRDSSG